MVKGKNKYKYKITRAPPPFKENPQNKTKTNKKPIASSKIIYNYYFVLHYITTIYMYVNTKIYIF